MGSKSMTIKQKEKAILQGLIFGALAMVPIIISSIYSNSLMVLADIFQSGSELLAVIFSYFAIRKVSKGADMVYNYGYGKLEGFSSLLMALVIGISLIIVLFNAYRGLMNPEPLFGIGVLIAIGVNSITASVSFWQWLNYRKIDKESPSPIITGQLNLYRSKYISDVGVALTLALGLLLRKYAFAYYIDPLGALILSGFLIRSIYTLFSQSMDNLMDRTLEESLQLGILRVLGQHFKDYRNIHDIRSRRSGQNIFVDLYLEFDPDKAMGEVQKAITQINADILGFIKNCQVNIVPCTGKPRIS
ncbi:MAG TPA: cation diffusion facilitator family transporter [Candidatus Marinimicrobia bacterium]|nr:cation diffusion facilitator family transporter [Candidatus Neomarinimicrobiota bacterium]